MPASQLKALYFQWLFENGNNYGMTSCPSGKKADRYEGLILLGHEKHSFRYRIIASYDRITASLIASESAICKGNQW